MEAAFKPEVNGELDTQNFMKFDELNPPTSGRTSSVPSRKQQLNPKDLNFVGYTYKNFDAVKALRDNPDLMRSASSDSLYARNKVREGVLTPVKRRDVDSPPIAQFLPELSRDVTFKEKRRLGFTTAGGSPLRVRVRQDGGGTGREKFVHIDIEGNLRQRGLGFASAGVRRGERGSNVDELWKWDEAGGYSTKKPVKVNNGTQNNRIDLDKTTKKDY
ncbi:hypothetical protein LXL04_008359 [Taraxacum kok-saghyz]